MSDGVGTHAWSEVRQALGRFIAARIANPADAEDVVQEVLVRAAANLPRLRDQDRLHSWLFRIARNAVADHYRSTQPARVAVEADAVAAPEPADVEGEEALLACLEPILARLGAGYREALLLADRDGLAQRDVARRLGLSLSGAKSRVQRARRMLRAAFESCCVLELDRRGAVVALQPRETRPRPECCEQAGDASGCLSREGRPHRGDR